MTLHESYFEEILPLRQSENLMKIVVMDINTADFCRINYNAQGLYSRTSYDIP